MELRGGTYISQVNADDLAASMRVWAKTLVIDEIKYFGILSQNELIKVIAENTPSTLIGLTNTWCFSCSLKVGFVIVNIVQTDISVS